MAASDYQVIDERFRACFNKSASLARLYEGTVWAEGPVYFPLHGVLLWSDIPNNRMLRWDERSGKTTVFRHESEFSNGNTVDRHGRLVSCLQGSRRVVRTEHDGSRTVLASHYQGKRLNSPNDVVVRSDNSIWFTDPSYGIDSHFEGNKAESEIGSDNVYRIDATSGQCEVVCDDFRRPNGLAFSPDETRLYIVDSGGARYPEDPRHIRVFDVRSSSQRGRYLSGGDILAECTAGSFDGFRLDESGRIWTSAHDGVHCLLPDGTLIGKILVPETVSNVVFGGPRRNRLFITATHSLYSVLLPVRGARTF